MGSGICGLYEYSSGGFKIREDNSDYSVLRRIRLPENESQLKHIFGDRPGHLADTLQNRSRIENLANDKRFFLGIDKRGHEWHARNDKDGQLWSETRANIIQDAGLNRTPARWDIETGLKNNPRRNNSWRKK